ncbi:short-chain dehydrogenase [Neisseria dentiae]|uniref:Short-chain dehydrogenase n=1 Tax=Neisseria dentiae TaxID=194197 RepID=A0A1X3DB79_9NEIS|nr:SDR family NAD(P)-dependent oxidoreductase [Neisseria dentiae]OSI17056.1 short-chain dehydrogenase [Neisseria dentiae]QMT45156.1 SDR family oxidoreductase [Neisseria dentiae]STZ50917.1 oxidoreductase [Neisseria dentiae]
MTPDPHTVLITGGASGIGFALAQKFHAVGNRVILAGRRSEALQQAAERLPGALAETADITRAQDRAALVQKYPDLNILVNNAGIQLNSPLAEQSEADITHELCVNLTAPILLTHAFLPMLLKQPHGAVVNVSSGLAIVPKEAASVYCASKAALHSFSQTLRWQLEHTGVKVFELMPPLVDTAMTAGRGKGKISPEALAEEFWQAFLADKYEIMGGKTKLLYRINRLFPKLAERIMRKGL